MNKFFLAALMLLPSLASARSIMPPPLNHPAQFTGKVVVEQPLCVRMPCYPIVSLENEAGRRIHVTGEMLRDIQSFEGKVLTVKGTTTGYEGSLNASEFATGKSSDFIMGKVVDLTNCPINAMCLPRVGIEKADGSVIEIDDGKTAMDLFQMVGGTVMIRGREQIKPSCDLCMGGPVVFKPFKGQNILVKGELGPIFHTMEIREPGFEYARHGLTLPNGQFVPVYGTKNWSDRYGRDVWVSGSFDGGKFRATKTSKAIVPDPVIEPFPWSISDASGSNVNRSANTDGASSVGVSGGSQNGAGTSR